ncbi:MAG: gliding motility-associated C-terminal domain-containing protein [Bacteroidia bacterium]|jgi:gliding motility-associated-like protein|nr:gliding motility-associated C-terminal domain-containing protein [Bacteroidia bacterium]
MIKRYAARWIHIVLLCTLGVNVSFAQSGNEFWLAPPEVTELHNSPGGEPIFLQLSSMGQAAVVTITQPANPGFTPITVNVAANRSARVNLTSRKTLLETQPTDVVLNTGLRIQSTTPITCYYEIANTNNTDIWALKGPNGLGQEFYIPLHKHAPFYNHTFAAPHEAYASFDIVATQNNTVVTIYSPVPVDGHPALQQFSIILNQGQTYSCGFTGTGYEQPSTHPSGAVVLADKPIAVSLKDDSNHNPSGGCYDLMGDQLVPVNVVGEDYIAVKGSLNSNGDESVVIVATENNTQIFLDGATVPVITLFAGEYYRVDMDYLSSSANNSVYIHATKPIYAVHVTGFGCESGMALLPPLNCAGSQQVNFVRSSSESFFVTLLVRSTAVNNFNIQVSGTATINPASFVVVPGTGGTWRAARIQYNTTQIPVDSTVRISNSADVFALGIINGGATSGCRYGYFSEFVAPITINAGINQTICANASATLAGTVAGGTTTGQWTTSGSGTFTPNNTTLNAVYTPSAGDAAVGSVTLTLTSTGACIPVSDNMLLTITPAPTANAGPDQSRCRNNAATTLSGAVTVASGGVWTGGAGTFSPSNSSLNPVYTPTAAELTAGSVLLTLTTTGNGICQPVNDNVLITFTPAPVVNAGVDVTRCANNPAVTLAGTVSGATGGVWTGGGGSFSPNATALNAVYTASAAEIAAGNVTLTLTSTGNGTCNAVTDQMTISFSAAPTANAGVDLTRCANNPAAALGGAVTIATGGVWSGGLGTYAPNASTLNATYTPTAAEIAAGSVTLTLTTTGNGTCSAVNDQKVIFYTPAPVVNAGTDITVCANNAAATLNGSFTVSAGAAWTGGAGTYAPNNTTMNAVYTPTAAERAAGTVTLTLTSTGNGSCNAVSDQVVITITPSPVVNAGADVTRCANNPAVTLAGGVTIATGGTWTGGSGTFSPNASALNAVYTASAAEIAAGSVTLTLTSTGNGSCNAVTDQMVIFFTAAPTANAGPDLTFCANNPAAALGGAVTIASGGVWSGGLGTYSPNASTLNATYTPTAAEIATGSVTLTLTTTGNGTCNAVTDQKVIFYTPAPTASAGGNITVCANNPAVTLNGAFTIASGAVWSGGAGSYSPNNTTMNAVYTPTAAEIASGSVTLTLTTTGNGSCNAVNDQVVITILPAPVVNAGPNVASCANNSVVSLSGIINNAGGGVWSGGGGTYTPNSSSLNITYTPTAAEIAAGSVTLTLTSTGNGSCSAVSDQVVITYAPAPVSNAGSDQTVCGNNATVSLAGFVNFCAGGQWSGGLGTFSPSPNVVAPDYTPTAGEIAAGFVNLILTTTGNGNCNAVRDTMRINFTPAPTVDAGAAVTACANNPAHVVNGSVTVAAGVLWSGGTGSFSPSATALSPVYTPSAAEIAAGSVMLFITTTGNGTCLPVTDSVLFTITSAPLVNAGNNQTVCVNNLNLALSGSISGPTNTGVWTTSGSGVFVPNSNALNAIYQCSSADSAAGSVTLVLTSTGNGSCLAVRDTMIINILPAGAASAGANITVCGNNSTVSLNGIISGGATGGTWATTGTGLFLPNNTTLNATYVPSGFDIANGGATLFLTANSCNPAVDSLTLTITPAPVVNAGNTITICADSTSVGLNGSVSGGTTTGLWTTSGSGTFSPSASTLNATYIPSIADVNAQVVWLTLTSTNNGSCIPVSDSVRLNIYPQGVAAAGPDQIVCSNNANIVLGGSITGGATQGQWSTTGDGVFVPNDTALNATYVPGPADLIAGSVSLILTATNSCNTAIDFLNVIITPAPAVDAGVSQSVCGANTPLTLTGTVSNATGAVWSGGNGTFSPNNTVLNAVYTPTAAEVNQGFVFLTLTSTGNGNCNSVSDTVTHFLSPGIVVNAGPNQSVCESSSFTQMLGSVANGTTTGQWSTLGSGTFVPNDSSMNALYMFSPADTASGSVTIILTSTNNGACPVARDTMIITFGPSAFAFAGADLSLCASDGPITLNGFVSGGATMGVWATTGSGTFTPNDSVLNATYTPSTGDYSTGFVTFILTTVDHGSCLPGIDTVTYTLVPASVVNAGGDVTICGDNLSVLLGGNVSGASATGVWSTTGSGTFVPNASTLNATYIPSSSDSLNGSVQLILTATNTLACGPDADTMVVNITPPAVVNAGSDQTTCAQGASVSLGGTVSGGTTTGQWSSTGTGIFTPNNTDLNAVYTPSPADLVAGSVQLILTSTGNGICTPRRDTMVVTIIPVAVVSAGPDRVVCGNQTSVLLNGLVTGTTSTGLWSTTGSGTFTPNTATLAATYTMSVADIAAGSVTLYLTSTNNGICPAVTDSMVITVEPLPVAAFSSVADDSLQIVFTDGSTGAVAWLWDFGAGGTSTDQNPTHMYPAAGPYTVTLIITSAGGCTDTAVGIVNAVEEILQPVELPTGFTPNGDGKNDVLHVLGGPFETVDFRLYNEWGHQVFISTDPDLGWDGTMGGKPQPAGIYVYTVIGTTVDGREVNISGNVTLIR